MSSENIKTLPNRQEGTARSNRWPHSVALSVLLCLSVTMNVFLARKMQISSQSSKGVGTLKVGSDVPPLAGRSEYGVEQTLRYGSSELPTVLYVFTPQCGWCKKNLDNLHALIKSSGLHYRLVGVSLTTQDLQKYVKDNRLTIPIYTDLDESTLEKYKFIGTPTTIVVSPKSKVLKIWTGAYSDTIRQDIDKYLQVELPGCCSE